MEAPGTFNVTLIVSDGTDQDEEVKVGYIHVTDNAAGLHASFVAF
jgi:hypothetical protein